MGFIFACWAPWVYLCSGAWQGHGESGFKTTLGYARVEAKFQASESLKVSCWIDHKVLDTSTICYADAVCTQSDDGTLWNCTVDARGTCVDEEAPPPV